MVASETTTSLRSRLALALDVDDAVEAQRLARELRSWFGVAKEIAPRLLTVVPGLRPAGVPAHDQARAATPSEALAAGADLLVIGRAVTAASDRAAAASELVASLA